MTVARVLHQPRQVRPATRERVEKALAATGYRPDPVLSALAVYRRQGVRPVESALAFLDCDGTPFSRCVYDGAAAEALLLGYRVERHGLEANRRRALNRVLIHRGVRGLLFGPSQRVGDFSDQWDWDEFAAVSLGALGHRPPMNAVAMNYFEGAYSATASLLGEGCRRVGLAVEATLEARSGHGWRGGYAAALDGEALRIAATPWDGRFRARVRRERWDGVLTIHPEVASLLHPLGVKVRFLNDTSAPPGFPCYALDPAEIGREGVRFLHHALLRQEYGLPAQPRRVFLNGRWRTGRLRPAGE